MSNFECIRRLAVGGAVIGLVAMANADLTMASVIAPVAWYECNGNGKDASGNGLHGAVVEATTCPSFSGNPTGAMCFDGLGDHIIVPDSPLLDITGQITIVLWAKWPPLVQQGFFVSKRVDGGAINYCMQAGYTITGYYTVAFQYGSLPTSVCSALLQLADGQWHCLAFSYVFGNPASATWCIDGAVVPSAWRWDDGTPGGGTELPTANDAPMLLGGQLSSSPGWLTGSLDNVIIYDVALNVQELRSICGLTAVQPVTWGGVKSLFK